MRYTPYSEAEIQSMNVVDAGIYTFQVLEVITTNQHGAPLTDKNGTDMAKLKLVIWDNQNRERTLFTFITGDGNFAYKLRHFAKSIGMIAEYEDGSFRIENTVAKSGKADIVIKKGTLKNDGSGEMWADRNDVKDFIAPDAEAPKAKPNAAHQTPPDDLNDEVPF